MLEIVRHLLRRPDVRNGLLKKFIGMGKIILGIIIYINIVRIKFIVPVHYVVGNYLEQKEKKFLLVNC